MLKKVQVHRTKRRVATVTRAKEVQQIAETKMPDLNAANIESAMRMIEGTARSMGFTVTDYCKQSYLPAIHLIK